MIAIDCQLLSIVEDRGFKSLVNALEPRYNLHSRHDFTENVIPHIHNGIMFKAMKKTSDVK